ncbi:globin domain-containing protein, partial [Echinicola sediminis]
GHPRLRMRHLQWAIDDKMRNHWLNNMLTALDRLDIDQNVKELMMSYFVKVANHMINQ